MLVPYDFRSKSTHFKGKAAMFYDLNTPDLRTSPHRFDYLSPKDSQKKSPLHPPYQKLPYLNPTYLGRGAPSGDKPFRSPSYQATLSPIREEAGYKKTLSRNNQRTSLDKTLERTFDRENSQIFDQSLKSKFSMTKKLPKKPKLFNEKHVDVSPLNEQRKKKINFGQIKDFTDKYTLKMSSGYSNKILEKCVQLLSSENDAFILENLFPGQFSMDINPIINSTGMIHADSGSNLANFHMPYNILNLQSPQNGESIGFLPVIRNKRPVINGENALNSTAGEREISSRSTTHESFSAKSGFFGLKKWKVLPKIDLEAFKERLHFYKDFVHKSSLFLIDAHFKEAFLEFGFCEIIWDDSKVGSVHLAKYYMQKMYRKMGLMIQVTVKVLDYFFKTYKLERISIDILPGNESMQETFSLLGFNFEKVFYRDEKKWQLYVLKRRSFYESFQDVLESKDYTKNTTSRGSKK